MNTTGSVVSAGVYSGQYEHGQKRGQGRFDFANGDSYEGPSPGTALDAVFAKSPTGFAKSLS
jgi:hypothetical protein